MSKKTNSVTGTQLVLFATLVATDIIIVNGVFSFLFNTNSSFLVMTALPVAALTVWGNKIALNLINKMETKT